MDRLLEKSKQTGIPFVPEPGGPLETLYKQKIASGQYPAPTPAVPVNVQPPPPTASADNSNWSSDTIVIS